MSTRVLAFRVGQAVRTKLMAQTGGWDRLVARADEFWDVGRIEGHLLSWPSGSLVAPDGRAAVHAGVSGGLLDSTALMRRGEAVTARDFRVLGAPVPPDGPWPWHQDWRYGFSWPPMASHDFYRPKDRPVPFDVKYPWELSRFWFAVMGAQATALGGRDEHLDAALAAVGDWEAGNPIPTAIGWNPMEASMRAINLCLLTGVARSTGITQPKAAGPLLRQLVLHGELIWRLQEYTEIRGNHYAANVAALAIIGLELEGVWPAAEHWAEAARRALSREMCDQFLPGGVHFEKSTAYHRLVTALFLLVDIASTRAGFALSPSPAARLEAAIGYVADLVEPDGGSPLFGDSDDAIVLPFDGAEPADPRPLIGLAGARSGDPRLIGLAGRFPVSAAWLLGGSGLARWLAAPADASVDHQAYRADGGIVTMRRGGSYFIMDVGEVGNRGLGGHGHNDLLSFELILGHSRVFVDPGSYCYTGDAKERDRFRGSAAHNGVMIDGLEIAPLLSMWRISPVAVPTEVSVEFGPAALKVRAGHQGYSRLADPVAHERTVSFDADSQAFECRDEVRSEVGHQVVRRLHLGPEVRAESAGPAALRLHVGGISYLLCWDPGSTLTIEDGSVSRGYFSRDKAAVLELAIDAEPNQALWFSLVLS